MRRVFGAAAALRLLARSLLLPGPRSSTLAERLGMLALQDAPVSAPVTIRWNRHAIPFIEAASDEDLAVALGVVHAHLRLGQIELIRRIAFGRIAEMVGPLGLELDRALRLFDFGRAVPAIIAAMSDETRCWTEAFVRGVNHQIARGPVPHEFRLFGLARERWTLAELLTMGRIASADVTWMVFARLLRTRRALGAREWAALWPRLLQAGSPAGWPPPGSSAAEHAVSAALRSGSNSAAVAAARSRTGYALIASDPHLSVGLPNLWLIAGMRSPSYHMVGLMLAGFPFVALGRNPWLAWGGTNLHAASSELFDLTSLSTDAFTERETQIRVRWGRSRRVRLRESPLGPVVSDGVMLRNDRPLALRWVGHRPSDEIGAMLAANRARDGTAFAEALAGFAIPGQTMVFASADGRIGRVTAAHLPRRPPTSPADLVLSPETAWTLDDLVDARDLPRRIDPPEGFVVSANDRPEESTFPLGFFFSSGERAARMRAILGAAPTVSPADLERLQADVISAGALILRDHLLAVAQRQAGSWRKGQRKALAILAAWDGSYGAESRGALLFEVILARIMRGLHRRGRLAPYAALWTMRGLIARDILEAPTSLLSSLLPAAFARAGSALASHGYWGGLHRMRLAHHLAALPVIGRRYVFGRYPAPGGNETLHKTSHRVTGKRHDIGYGSCARHISDLADPDANRFVLLGGQDGWLGSENFLDQVPLWRSGRYITVPLTRAAVAEAFAHVTVLRPGA